MKSPVIAILAALSLTACAGMKEKMAQMQQKSAQTAQQAADSANTAAANHEPSRPWDPRDPRRPQDPGPPATDTATAASGGAVAAGATDSGASEGGSSSSEGAVDSATADSTTTDSTTGSSSEATGSQDASTESFAAGDAGSEGGSDGAVEGTVAAYSVDCTVPQNKPEDVEVGGTESYPGSESKKGWFTRVRYAQGLEMTDEVKEEREASFLKETRTYQNGQLLSCALLWTPRYFKPVETTEEQHQIDYESKTTDLADETIKVGDREIHCKVQKVWSRVMNQESTSYVWSSDAVPFGTVKMEQEVEGGRQLVYELLEFRR